MRQQRPTKIHPPNISPGKVTRQPLRNIINITRTTGKDGAREDKPVMRKQPLSSYLKFQGEGSTVTEQQTSYAGSGHVKSARNSLKPPKKLVQKSICEDSCSNHPDKQAKFRVYSEESDLFYCEKCAILLASQGFKVDRLTSSNSSMLLPPPSLSSPHSNNPFVKESEAFMEEVTAFLEESRASRSSNEEERNRVQFYYRSLLEQIDKYQDELKKSIGIMMNQQRLDIMRMAGDNDRRFEERLHKMEEGERQLEIIVRDIQINLEIIGSLDESEFQPIMRKYEQTLRDYAQQLHQQGKVEYSKVELVQPKPEAVQQLIGIISQCGLQLRMIDGEHSSKKKGSRIAPEPEATGDRRFFTFEKNLQREQERPREDSRLRMSELRTDFDMPLQSYVHHPGEEEVMQESIIHDDFNSDQ